MEVEGNFRAMKSEADGLREMAAAYRELRGALGGLAGLLQWVMVKEGTFERLVGENARPVQRLQPKISVWNTGAQASGGADGDAAGNAIRGVFQNLPPLFGTIHEQTVMKPPGWMWDMGEQEKEGQQVNGEIKDLARKDMVNGH